jgi:hypothetical protein
MFGICGSSAAPLSLLWPTTTTMLEKSGFSVVDLKLAANVDGILRSVQYVFEDAKLNPK